jgi:non-canonical poly(A) RNA polymerase PAPD5/7
MANTASRLGSEVAAFAKWIHPTDAEAAARNSVIKQTMSIAKSVVSQFEIEPFGSSRTGLGLACSDVDLRLFKTQNTEDESENWLPQDTMPLPPSWLIRKETHDSLRILRKTFGQHLDYRLCDIRYARYPLLHMQHVPSGIVVQIVCANDTAAQRTWIEKALRNRPHIADLYAVLKTTLDTRGLTDVYQGGIGSYAIFVMIVAALEKLRGEQYKPKSFINLKDQNIHEQLGRDLRDILRFWGHLDTYKWAVATKQNGILPKIDPKILDEIDLVSSDFPNPTIALPNHSCVLRWLTSY